MPVRPGAAVCVSGRLGACGVGVCARAVWMRVSVRSPLVGVVGVAGVTCEWRCCGAGRCVGTKRTTEVRGIPEPVLAPPLAKSLGGRGGATGVVFGASPSGCGGVCERAARCVRCRCVCSGGMDAGVGEVAVGVVGVAGGWSRCSCAATRAPTPRSRGAGNSPH